MKALFTLAILLLALDVPPVAHYGHHGAAVLPDPQTTPGKVRTIEATEVCAGGSTKQYRHTTATEKSQVYLWYGAKKVKGQCCEVDHLIPLELGGADELPNLWPEPYEPRPGAHEKDHLENFLHAQVCAGKMTLTQAQAEIAKDWYAAYQQMESVTQ
jgi:hypothetical protein